MGEKDEKVNTSPRGGNNPHTGDRLVSKPSNENYRDGYDRIFKKDRCKLCSGTGWIGMFFLECTNCKGTGRRI